MAKKKESPKRKRANAAREATEGRPRTSGPCKLPRTADHKQPSAALPDAGDQYQNFLREAVLGIFHSTLEGVFIDVNSALARMMGYDSPEQVISSVADLAGQVYTEPLERDVVARQTLEAGGTITTENRYLRKDGTLWHGLLHLRIVKDEQGKPGCYEGFIEDITARRKAEEKSRQSLSLLKATLQSTADGILVVDGNGRIADFNEQFAELWGIPNAILDLHDDRKALDFVLDQLKDPEQFIAKVRELYAQPEATSFDVLEFKDGRFFERYSQAQRIDGKPVGRVWSFRDVTERRRADQALRVSEEKYRSLIETTNTGYVILDGRGMVMDANPEYLTLTGRKHMSEVIGHSVLEWTAPYDRERNAAAVGKCIAEGHLRNFEVDYLSAAGKTTPIEINATFLREGGTFSILSLCRDITERRKSEKELRTREKQLAESQRIAHIGSWEHNLGTGGVFWSDELFRLLGLDPEKDPADVTRFFEMLHPDDRPVLKNAMEATLQRHIPFSIDYRFVLRDGAIRIIHAQAELMPNESGNLVILSGTAQDITERKKVEEELAISEHRYRSLFEDSPISMWEEDITELQEYLAALRSSGTTDFRAHFTDYPGEVKKCVGLIKFVSVNKTTLDIYEATDQTALLQGFSKIVTAESLEAFREIMIALAGGAPMYECETINRTLAGKKINVLLRWSLLATDRSKRSRALISIVDITSRKEAVEKIRQSEDFIRSILDTVDEGFLVIDRDYRILTVNKAYCSQVARTCDEIIGKHCFEISHNSNRPCYDEGEECSVRRVFASGEPYTVLHKHVNRDGQVLYVETKGFPIKDADGNVVSVIETINNITEKHLLEEERLKTQKLESIGTLAGGIAHDFNNLLQGIFGYISMAKMTFDQKEKSFAMLEQAEKALHQSVNLTTQLLTFSKGGKPVKKVIDLTPVIENAVKFALSGSRSTYSIDLDPALRHVNADAGQLGQVIQNIVLNADQAMPLGGVVRITAQNTAANDASLPPTFARGDYVSLTIEDNGIGIPEQYLNKIFDPYFTTKDKGSGLGLATSYSIIKNHDGLIRASSAVGKGTVFSLYLPVASEKADAATTEQAAPSALSRARVLVMDDEKLIRNLARELLHALGHEVEVAAHGEEAVTKYRAAMASGRPFSLVILDLTIRGGMGGAETIKKLRELDPGVRAVVSSGYSEDDVLADHLRYGFKAFLKKPYNVDELSSILNSLLSR